MLKIPDIQKIVHFEDCNDLEYCKSSLSDDINKTNCLNHNGAWNLDDDACDYRYYLDKKCEKRIGNWIYPYICNEQ